MMCAFLAMTLVCVRRASSSPTSNRHCKPLSCLCLWQCHRISPFACILSALRWCQMMCAFLAMTFVCVRRASSSPTSNRHCKPLSCLCLWQCHRISPFACILSTLRWCRMMCAFLAKSVTFVCWITFWTTWSAILKRRPINRRTR
uniref:Secreted protein n=1 Tax=Ixodes ricinus TaxID=34613 RepID=A0A6B0UUX2_IXORI